MILGSRLRRLLVAVHLMCSVGWIGAVVAYLALALSDPATDDPTVIRAAWLGMEIVGWYAIVPLALGSLGTGVLMAALTKWGLLRHYWVLVSLVSTMLLTAVLVVHMSDVSAQADLVRTADEQHVIGMGSDIAHAVIGLVLLIGILELNIDKPRGLTKYGWRKEQAALGRARTARAWAST